MIIEILLLLIALLGLILASIFDLKTTEVPDYLSYFLIITGLSLRFLHATTYKLWYFFTHSLLTLAIFFIIGSLFYYSKQWGGADAKLLMALGVLFPIYPSFLQNFLSPNLSLPFSLILIINILIAGALYGFIWSICLAIKHRKRFLERFKSLFKITKRLRNLSYLLTTLLIILSLIIKNTQIKIILITAAVIVLLLLYFWIFIKAVEDTSMYKLLPPSKLREGDWLVKNIKYRGKEIAGPSSYGLTKHQINVLRRLNLKHILIKEGIPFIPSFLLGFLLSILIGNPLAIFL